MSGSFALALAFTSNIPIRASSPRILCCNSSIWALLASSLASTIRQHSGGGPRGGGPRAWDGPGLGGPAQELPSGFPEELACCDGGGGGTGSGLVVAQVVVVAHQQRGLVRRLRLGLVG